MKLASTTATILCNSMESRKDKINSKDITERFVFNLFDSSVELQIAERVYTLRSLIDRKCGIVGGGRWGEVGVIGRVEKK